MHRLLDQEQSLLFEPRTRCAPTPKRRTCNWASRQYEGGTKLDLQIDYTIPVPVLGKLAEKLVLKRHQRDADTSMENLKERLEG